MEPWVGLPASNVPIKRCRLVCDPTQHWSCVRRDRSSWSNRTSPSFRYSNYVLSIVIPVLNDEFYIEECVASCLRLDISSLEVCVCDNASTDSTTTIVESIVGRDSRVRVEKHEDRVDAVTNWKRAFEMSRGELVLFLGSDDYLVDGPWSLVVNDLEGSTDMPCVFLRMEYFSDLSGQVLERLPPDDVVKALGSGKASFVEWMISHSNHDELIYAVWRRSLLAAAIDVIRDPAMESTAWWWTLAASLSAGPESAKSSVTDEVLLRKRYEKKRPESPELDEGSSTTVKRRRYQLRPVVDRSRLEFRRRTNTVANAIQVHALAGLSWSALWQLVFATRKHSSGQASFNIASLGHWSPRRVVRGWVRDR